MNKILGFLLTILPAVFIAQVQDNFEDGNFNLNPTWQGDDSVFVVTDDGGNLKLRSNKTITNSTFYLATTNTRVQNTQFEFNVRLAFSTSGSNYVDVYLAANQSDLLTADGYFVRIGNTTDEVSLYKISGGTETKIIDGTDGVVSSSSNNNFKIKVICDGSGNWSLYHDNSGTGNSYTLEGNINDNTIITASFFGIKVKQSTASFFQKHFLDNVVIGDIVFDVTAPNIVSTTIIDNLNIDVLFDENLDQVSAENTNNYDLIPFNSINTATLDAVNKSLVHLLLDLPLSNGNTYNLTINNIADLVGNDTSNLQANFTYLVPETAAKGDILITEFFCDPSPRIGLPEIEFVEIYNNSSKVIDLNGWKLRDNSSAGTITSAFILPGEYKTLCPSSAIDSFPNTVAVTSFQSLNNSGDNIVIRDNNGVLIDSLTYSDSWYKDDIKKNGGYTIERINLNDPCSAADNWIASVSLSGGTPGLQNSVFDNTPDTEAPTIISSIALAPNFLIVKFNEGLDSLSLVNSVATISPSLSISNKYVFGTFPDSITFEFGENIQKSITYTISINNIQDCWNNTTNVTSNFLLADDIVVGDLIINEILFDPYTGGQDFIELRNNSTKVLNINGLSLANFKDSISNIKTITQNYNLLPNDFVVITSDTNFVIQNYSSTVPGKFIKMSIPSYSNDSSTVFLLNQTTQILDKVSYTDDWHFQLLDDTDGKSLERISYTAASNDKNNWQTASEQVGFATPGRENSQRNVGENAGEISLTSDVFSPDNDGFEDILQINYNMIEPGYMANIKIYDHRGRLIRNLVKSQLIGNEGFFKWDGVNDQNTKASIGTYVLIAEFVDLNGNIKNYKKAFVLAGK